MTKKQETQQRLKRLEAAYKRACAETDALPDGNGFATQKEMERANSEIYFSTIVKLRRDLERMR